MRTLLTYLAVLAAVLFIAPQATGQVRGRGGTALHTVNVADYGAAPGDTTSDAVAIQAALDAVHNAGGGQVAVTVPGTYVLTQTDSTLFTCLKIYDNTALVGVPGVTFQRRAGVAAYMLRNASGASGNTNITVEGIIWDANAAWVAREGTYTAATGTLVFANCSTRSLNAPLFTYSSANQPIVEMMSAGAGTWTTNGRCLITSSSYAAGTNGGTLTLTVANSTGTTSWSGGTTTWQAKGDTNMASGVKVRIRQVQAGSDTTAGWVRCSLLFTSCTNVTIRGNTFYNEYKYSSWCSGGSNILEENNTFNTASDGHHHEGPIRRVTIRDVRGVCEDNMLAFSSDEGTFFTPNDAPFTAGDIEEVLVDGVHMQGGLTPFSIFGSDSYVARNIQVKNFNGVINEGNGLTIKDATSNGLEGINLYDFVCENIHIRMDYASSTAPAGLYIDMLNLQNATFRDVSFLWRNTAGGNYIPATILYVKGSANNWKSITVDGFAEGERGANQGTVAQCFQFDEGAAGAQQNLQLMNGRVVFGYTTGLVKTTASCKSDMSINCVNIMMETEDGTTASANPQVFRIDANSSGLRNINCSNVSFITQRSGGQGTFLSNVHTDATSGRAILTMMGGEIRNLVYFVEAANDADNKTRLLGSGTFVNGLAADALNDGATTGELSVNFPGLSWGGDSYRGTAVKGDRFVNTYTGGAPFAALGAIPVLYDGTNWIAD